MSDEIQSAIAELERELASIEEAHRGELEQHRGELVRMHHTELSSELKRLNDESQTARAKLEALNHRVDARTSSRWEAHVAAAGLAVAIAAAVLMWVAR
ncbi:MAG: hypothetical protein QM817_17010 [Archangium sp.]